VNTVTKSVKMPVGLARLLKGAARRASCSESELIRRGIEQITSDCGGLDMKALLEDDCGAGNGPKDLSTNRKYLQGYGTSRHR